jgi:hypothetical protein
MIKVEFIIGDVDSTEWQEMAAQKTATCLLQTNISNTWKTNKK